MGDRYSDLNCTFEVKSEGDNVARFTGVASTSDEDQHGDIIAIGAFDPIASKMAPDGKSIPDVMMLRDHDRGEVIGGWQSFAQQGRQLKVEGELCLDVSKARETHTLMKRGYLSGLSVGFSIKNIKDIEFDERTGRRTIKKATLRECSIVGFPANTRARVLNVKSMIDDLLTEGNLDTTDLLLALLDKQEKQAKPPEPKSGESQKDYMSRCLDVVGASNGGMAACSKRWKEHNKGEEQDELKRMVDLIKGIDGYEPINETKVMDDLRGLLTQVKGYRHV